MRDRKKGVLTVLEDKILSLNGFLLFLLMLLSAKKNYVEIILSSPLFGSCSQLCYGHKERIKMDWHKVEFPVSFRVMFSALSTLVGSVLHFENSNKRAENIRKHNSLFFSFLMKLSVLA